jgi:TolB protein
MKNRFLPLVVLGVLFVAGCKSSEVLPEPSITPVPSSDAEPEIAVSVLVDGNYNLFLMDLSGDIRKQLTFSLPNARSSYPDWSPDGNELVFTTRKYQGYEIYLLEIETGEITRLTDPDASERDPVWSPDGSKLAYASGTEDGMQIFIMDSDGQNKRQLTFLDGDNRDPEWSRSWSPSGGWIYFVHGSGFDYDLYRVNLVNNTVELVFDDEFDIIHPRISPDGRWIIFNSKYRAGTSEIYIIGINGNHLRRLTVTGGQEMTANWSPDGRNIIYVKRIRWASREEVWIMDLNGSNPQLLVEGLGFLNPVIRPCYKSRCLNQ